MTKNRKTKQIRGRSEEWAILCKRKDTNVNLQEFDTAIRKLVPPNSRPFLCEGSPLDCELFIVGNNPGTETPFWDYWELPYGCRKSAWLADFWKRHKGERKPVRANMEIIIGQLGGQKYLETNAYAPWSKWTSDLKGNQLSTEIFEFLLRTIQPRLIFAHGAESKKYILKNIDRQVELEPKAPIAVNLLGFDTNVYIASKSLMYWSHHACESVGKLLRNFLQKASKQRST